MQVSLPHIGLLPATVETTEPGAVVVVLAVDDDRVQRLVGREVAVEYATGRGIHRFGGTLQLDDSRPEQLRVVLDGDVERIQRRELVRVEATLPVTVKGIDEPIGGETTTLNVSGGGVLRQGHVEAAARPRRPHRARARARRRADPRARPRRARAGRADQKGIRIDGIAREDEERLVRLVRERELAALRMSRGR